jgi:hypothetical protein
VQGGGRGGCLRVQAVGRLAVRASQIPAQTRLWQKTKRCERQGDQGAGISRRCSHNTSVVHAGGSVTQRRKRTAERCSRQAVLPPSDLILWFCAHQALLDARYFRLHISLVVRVAGGRGRSLTASLFRKPMSLVSAVTERLTQQQTNRQ